MAWLKGRIVVRKKEQGGKEEWRKVAKRKQAGWKGGREQGGKVKRRKQGGKETGRKAERREGAG